MRVCGLQMRPLKGPTQCTNRQASQHHAETSCLLRCSEKTTVAQSAAADANSSYNAAGSQAPTASFQKDVNGTDQQVSTSSQPVAGQQTQLRRWAAHSCSDSCCMCAHKHTV